MIGFSERKKPKRMKEDSIYFNSNSYLGHKFLTAEALNAGYKKDSNVVPKESKVVLAAESLLSPDANQIILDAEERLLRFMVNYSSARLAMKVALSNTMDNGLSLLEWSTPEREWLFKKLVGSEEYVF